MQSMTLAEAPAHEANRADAIGHTMTYDYFGTGKQVIPGPQAYLGNLLDPGAEIYPHFHDVDQFQIVVGGNGRFGRYPVEPIMVQYADGFSTYGPIVAGDEGISFFSLRLAAASGGWKMPGHAHVLPGKPGRRFFVDVKDYKSRPADPTVSEEALWGPDADGLAVRLLRFGPGATRTIDPGDCGGHYILVCDGVVEHLGKGLTANALAVQNADEPATELVGGSEGAVVLELKFARPSDRPGSNPGARTGEDYVRAL